MLNHRPYGRSPHGMKTSNTSQQLRFFEHALRVSDVLLAGPIEERFVS
jgi:hypothetical protein